MDDIDVAYVSTPKVASNSIRNLIRQRQAGVLFDHHESLKGDKEFKAKLDKKIKRRVKPSQALEIKNNRYFFSFVRNPLTRLYSCYRDKVLSEKRKHSCTFSPYGIEAGISFEEFVYRVADIPDDRSNDHFRSLNNFLVYEGKPFVDYVGKIEHFKEDWQFLNDRFGLPRPPRDERSKRVSGPAVPLNKLPYTQEMAEIAVKRYAKDIELYDYADDIDFLFEKIKASSPGTKGKRS